MATGRGGELNDEALELRQPLPGCPTCKTPTGGRAAAAIASSRPVIVLDDGFQHRRIGRDSDIVLLDAVEPFGLASVSAGMLREPVAGLAAGRRCRPVPRRSARCRRAERRFGETFRSTPPRPPVRRRSMPRAADLRRRPRALEPIRGQTVAAFAASAIRPDFGNAGKCGCRLLASASFPTIIAIRRSRST